MELQHQFSQFTLLTQYIAQTPSLDEKIHNNKRALVE